MPNADIVLEIAFNISDPGKTVIRTNAKKEALDGILEAWLSCQIGQSKDKSKAEERDLYKIKIQMDLSDDSFYTSSDTGNKGLTCGIVMAVFKRLDQTQVLALS